MSKYIYSHKMNKNKFNELQYIFNWYYKPNQNFKLQSEPEKVNANMLQSKIMKENNGELSPDALRNVNLGYGYNKTSVPYLLIKCYESERDALRRNHYFDDNYKKLNQELFNKYFEVSGDFMKTITLK